jgi:hypothetical protein
VPAESKGSGDWGDAYEQAKALVALMTDEEKNNASRVTRNPSSCGANHLPGHDPNYKQPRVFWTHWYG